MPLNSSRKLLSLVEERLAMRLCRFTFTSLRSVHQISARIGIRIHFTQHMCSVYPMQCRWTSPIESESYRQVPLGNSGVCLSPQQQRGQWAVVICPSFYLHRPCCCFLSGSWEILNLRFPCLGCRDLDIFPHRVSCSDTTMSVCLK